MDRYCAKRNTWSTSTGQGKSKVTELYCSLQGHTVDECISCFHHWMSTRSERQLDYQEMLTLAKFWSTYTYVMRQSYWRRQVRGAVFGLIEELDKEPQSLTMRYLKLTVCPPESKIVSLSHNTQLYTGKNKCSLEELYTYLPLKTVSCLCRHSKWWNMHLMDPMCWQNITDKRNFWYTMQVI